MGLAGGHRPHPRALIFDLDRSLIDARNAWRYCIEESIAASANRRVDAGPLIEEYHTRPWRDALSILAESFEEAARCERLCADMYQRSAMKKLLVHEGVGMALDALRGERIELGAISRLPHAIALKQVQSTGLDRFLAVLSATPAAGAWQPDERFADCLAFLEARARDAAFVSGDSIDRGVVARAGGTTFAAAWAPDYEWNGSEDGEAIASPSVLHVRIMAAWASRPPRQ